MPNDPPVEAGNHEWKELRACVENFLLERLAPKLETADKAVAKAEAELADAATESDHKKLVEKKEQAQEKRQKVVLSYAREVWLENAAKRVAQIQTVTHALKFSSPFAKGSSLNIANTRFIECEHANDYVGTHSVPSLAEDVVGNAAALDVFKFLSLEHNKCTLLEYVRRESAQLLRAFSDDEERARQWMGAFSSIVVGKGGPASHTLASQVYFPLQDGGYHLLAPLFPTSLKHEVHERLSASRYGEAITEARLARKQGRQDHAGYTEFPNMAVQIMGGTKPQNISQLNSERHGENWLLPSYPPNWDGSKRRPPMDTNTIFRGYFGRRPAVRELTRILAKFLVSTSYNNMHIRRTRADLVDRLVDELWQCAAEAHEFEPGWSADAACRLNQDEALWLDPGRAGEDEAFASLLNGKTWCPAVAARFGKWLNAQLRYHTRKKGALPMGDAEHNEWKRVTEPALELMAKELAHV